MSPAVLTAHPPNRLTALVDLLKLRPREIRTQDFTIVLPCPRSAEPPTRLAAQGVLNQFSYDNLRLSGIQVDGGILGASELTGTTVGGVRVDYGRIAPS